MNGYSYKKIDLRDCTFIIPIKFDSECRKKNAKITLNFLNQTFDTNFIIYELGKYPQLPELINITSNMKYLFELDPSHKKIFHRTKYLNIMLNQVTTTVVANYDIDVLLPIKSYVSAYKYILANNIDVVYPYTQGHFLIQIPKLLRDQIDNTEGLLDKIRDANTASKTYAGHAQFFKTAVYLEGGGENERFVSYGPEDQERIYRFGKLGYKVNTLQNSYVYHLEHMRYYDSNEFNPFFESNAYIWKEISKFSIKELRSYYNIETFYGEPIANEPEFHRDILR